MQIKMIHLNDPNALIEWSNTMDGVSKNINDYNPRRNRKILIICYDMIADVKCNKKLQAIIEELFIRYSLIFLFQNM